MPLPTPNPLTAELIPRGLPLDLLETVQQHCKSCSVSTTQDKYRTMMDGWGGMGAPFFVAPFLKRRSTVGKMGRKSEWLFCRGCATFRPLDDNAHSHAATMGFPEGLEGRLT